MASYAWRDIVLELEEAVTSSAGVHDPRVVEGCAACQPLQKSLVRLFRTRERVVQDFRLDIREQLGSGRDGCTTNEQTGACARSADVNARDSGPHTLAGPLANGSSSPSPRPSGRPARMVGKKMSVASFELV